MKVERLQKVLIASLVMVLSGFVTVFVVAPFLQGFRSQIEAVGVSLVTAGLVAVAIERIVLAALVEEVGDVLKEALGGLTVRSFGVREVRTGYFYTDIHERLKLSREFVVLQTWSPDMANLLDHAEQVVRRGGKVAVYLLHPESVFAVQRGVDLGVGRAHVPDKIRTDTAEVRARYRRLGRGASSGKLKLHYYNKLPAFALYRVDDTAWIAPYWYRGQSDSRSTLVLDIPSPMWKDYAGHLEELAKHSVEVPLDREVEPALPL